MTVKEVADWADPIFRKTRRVAASLNLLFIFFEKLD
jgi:hypothetical protein